VRDGRIDVERGVVADAETVVHIADDDAWIDYLYEMRTRIGLLELDGGKDWARSIALGESHERAGARTHG